MKKEDFMKKEEKVWIDDTLKGKSMYKGEVSEVGILKPPKCFVGECDDGSKRVYQVNDGKKFAVIKIRIIQDEWDKFRYKNSEVPGGVCFKCTNSKNETQIVQLVDDTSFEPLVGIRSDGTKIYIIEMKISFI